MVTFLVYWVSLASLIAIVFEVSQMISVAYGQIPARGVHEWQGKPFLHWDAFVCQKYGDLVCLSGLTAAVFVAGGRLKSTVNGRLFLVVSVILGVIAAVVWIASVQKQFAAGKFSRWDWGFSAPAGMATFAGMVHLAYFAVEATVIGFTLFYLLWQPIGLWIRIFMAACIVGYAITAIVDAKKIGMSGGPFGVSSPTKDK